MLWGNGTGGPGYLNRVAVSVRSSAVIAGTHRRRAAEERAKGAVATPAGAQERLLGDARCGAAQVTESWVACSGLRG